LEDMEMKSVLYGVLAVALTAVSASAEMPPQGPVAVRIADLDLNNPAQAERALDRLERAARHVCLPDGPLEDNLRLRRAVDACAADALAQAVARLNAPEVSRQHAELTDRAARVRSAALR
jgi:UrcA family protein